MKYIFQLWQESWLGQKPASDEEDPVITIRVPSTVVLQESFEYWRQTEGSDPYFFSSFGTDPMLWLRSWNVLFSGKYKKSRRLPVTSRLPLTSNCI
jgi:hypothetical protein